MAASEGKKKKPCITGMRKPTPLLECFYYRHSSHRLVLPNNTECRVLGIKEHYVSREYWPVLTANANIRRLSIWKSQRPMTYSIPRRTVRALIYLSGSLYVDKWYSSLRFRVIDEITWFILVHYTTSPTNSVVVKSSKDPCSLYSRSYRSQALGEFHDRDDRDY